MNPYYEGRIAYREGILITNCPYFAPSVEWHDWTVGWMDAEDKWLDR